MGIIKGLMDSALKVSHEDLHAENRIEVMNVLLKNRYSRALINQALYKCESEQTKIGLRQLTNYYHLPCILVLPNKINRCISMNGGRLAVYNLETVWMIYSKLKEIIPMLEQSGLIYKIPC